jgi:ABC-type transporter Mla MlaB component
MADFHSAPPPPITASGSPLTWKLESRAGGTLAHLAGEINENADLIELRRQLRGDVELDLEGVTRVNSCGVREWVNFVRALDGHVDGLQFARCSPTVVLQLNTIFNFRGRARVVSFLAPYVCEVCHVDEYRLLVVAEHFPDRAHPHVPAFRCGRCGGVMIFDELPERYLSFLIEEAGE